MHIAMIGAGYVGLVSGACFSDFGHQVVCIDSNAEKVASLNNGDMPIHEPGLAELVERNVAQGRLAFASDLKSAVSTAEAVFIAVGTPSRRGDGHADLSYVYAAAREIAGVIPKQAVVVTKSTVPVGTGDEVERIIRERILTPRLLSFRIPSSCVKARRSGTSSILTGSLSEPKTRAPGA